MAETEIEAKFEKQIRELKGQVNALSAQLSRVHAQVTHPGFVARVVNQTTNKTTEIVNYSALTLDQSTPQSVINGVPTFVDGLLVSAAGNLICNGSVGIGAASPETLLHITKVNATPIIRLERNDTTISTDDIVGRLEVEGQDAGAAGICAKLEAVSEGNAGETGWRFSTGIAGSPAEVARMDYLGNVGIGVVLPDAQLHVEHVTGAVQRLTRKDTAVTADDIIGRIEFETQDTGSAGVAVYVQAIAEGSAGEVGLALATGVGGTPVERMRIRNNGVFNIDLPPTHANNAAALGGGLVSGDLYRTGGDPDLICVAH